MQSIYIIALSEPSKDVRDNIVRMYSRHHYPISDTLYLISDDGGKDRATAIRAQIGIAVGVDKPSGVVTRVDSDFSGILPESVVDWWHDELGVTSARSTSTSRKTTA